ncbi:MAG: type IV secretory system conjugative DNA transfer family protein, partial [Angelakisella sp.]
MLGLSKEDRITILITLWISAFIAANVAVCYALHRTVTLLLLLGSLTMGIWLKLLFPTMLTLIAAMVPLANLKEIKSDTTGDGQHGTARLMTDAEVKENYTIVKPGHEKVPGFVVGLDGDKWIVETSDKSMVLMAPPGAGKSKRVIVPNIYYNAAVNINTAGKGASLLCTDMKGELIELCGGLLEESGYSVAVLNLRFPFNSHCFNLINNTNRYMDAYLKTDNDEARLISYGAAERYAKMLAQSIVYSIDTSAKSEAGQYFNETAQG